MMQIVKAIPKMQQLADQYRAEGNIIGFVPTMGYLHEGHLSLMRLARSRCDILVCSIFVNPTQFGPDEDYDNYPRDFERDEQLCREEKVDIIFYPDSKEMYGNDYQTYVNVETLSKTMCGLNRPGHFQGVTTVVCKLFNIVKPQLAVFGQKDYQQALIIQKMVTDLNFDVEIVTGPIVRESDGLAMSSRNKYLSTQERRDALSLHKSLQLAEKLIDEGERNSANIYTQMKTLIQATRTAVIDYIVIVDGGTLDPVDKIRDNTLIALAVKTGKTRLIDNTLIRV